MRICIIGDELVGGMGDPKALGWVGRVIARTAFPEPPAVLPLPFPGENTGHAAPRWESEALPRLAGDPDPRLIVAVGVADVLDGVSTLRSRLNIANIADQATGAGVKVMVVGPPPLAGVDRSHLEELSRAAREVAARRELPFVELFSPLAEHDQWFEDMATSPARSVHGATVPAQAGHALIAWLVLHQGWFDWIGAPARD